MNTLLRKRANTVMDSPSVYRAISAPGRKRSVMFRFQEKEHPKLEAWLPDVEQRSINSAHLDRFLTFIEVKGFVPTVSSAAASWQH